jgi:hypothetical protein
MHNWKLSNMWTVLLPTVRWLSHYPILKAPCWTTLNLLTWIWTKIPSGPPTTPKSPLSSEVALDLQPQSQHQEWPWLTSDEGQSKYYEVHRELPTVSSESPMGWHHSPITILYQTPILYQGWDHLHWKARDPHQTPQTHPSHWHPLLGMPLRNLLQIRLDCQGREIIGEDKQVEQQV